MIDQVGDRNRLTIGEDVVSTLGGAAAPDPGVGPNVWYQTILGEAGKLSDHEP
jgi:hypothetical protein